MKEKLYSIGKSMERVDALSKIRGDTRFITDVYVDQMTYAYPIYSSVPFARIKGIELPENPGQYGFLNLILPDQIPGANQVGVIIEQETAFSHTFQMQPFLIIFIFFLQL